jgi:hypothetical protein
VTAAVTAEELREQGSLHVPDKNDAFSAELRLLAKRVHENLSARAPRGASGKVAALSEAIKCAAQDVFFYINGRLAPQHAPRHIREAWGDPPAWLQALAGRASSEEVDVTMRGHLDAVSLTAYAIARGIDWNKTGLKDPTDGGIIDRGYFQKHYLSRPDVMTLEGLRLASRVLEQIDPAYGREKKRPDPAHWPKWARQQHDSILRWMDRLPAKAKIYGEAWGALKQQHPDAFHDSSSS